GVLQAEIRLAKTFVPLQIIERLFRIEAAALPSEMQTVFEALTQEIAALHREMRSTLTQQFESLAATQRLIEAAMVQLAKRAEAQKARVAETRLGVDRSLALLDERIEGNRRRSARLAAEARLMAEAASDVMVGLQYQDVMRQRSDHIREALAELVERAEACSSRNSPIDAARVRRVCQIEARQIEAIDIDLGAAAKRISAGIEALSRRLEGIDRDRLSLADLRAAIASAAATVDTLVSSPRKCEALVSRPLAGARETYDSVEAFGGIAMNVTAALQRLTVDIKLIALNAQIQAAQMGEGTGLEVLSEQTCELSEQTGRFTSEIGKDLEQLVSLL